MAAEDIVIPIFALTSICTTVFGLYYLRNKENMALIEKGMNPRSTSPEPKVFSNLRYGLLLAGGGLGLFLAFIIEWSIAKTFKEQYPISVEGGGWEMKTYMRKEQFPELYFAFIILFAGAGLVTAYLIQKKHQAQNK